MSEPNVDRLLLELRQRGESAATTAAGWLGVSAARMESLTERLRITGQVEVRRLQTAQGLRTFIRLPGQDTRPDVHKPMGLGRDPGKRYRVASEEAERTKGGATLADRMLATIEAAGDTGLTLVDAVAACPGDESDDVKADRVRSLWQAGKLARTRAGTFTVGSTRRWWMAEPVDEDEEAA